MTSLGPLETDSNTLSKEALSHHVEKIALFIESKKPEIQNKLRQNGRSRVARQVSALPTNSKELQTASFNDLPVCSEALALASASTCLTCLQEGDLRQACKSADLCMIMLGLPEAKCLFALLPLFEEGSLSGEKRFADDDALGLPVRNVQPVAFPANMRMPIQELQHMAMKPEDFRAYFRSDTPVVIRNYARDWPACNKWREANYFGYAHGHRHVPVEITTPDEATCTSRPEEGLMSLSDVVEHMLAPGEKMVYMAQHPLLTYLPDLCDDVKQPELIEVANKHTADICNVWMGTAGTGSALHFDSPDNLLVQLVGDKQVLLLPPSDKQYLQLPHSQSNISPINLENVTSDTDLTPLHGRSAVLHPGDMLYIPAQHWHYLKSLTSSISVNFWF